jgi:hypothetical protein
MAITLDGTTGITTPAETVSGAVTASTVTATGLISGSTNYTGFKNKIIGGDFTTNPWQRGTSFPAIGSGVYFADRWQASHATSAVLTASKAADAPTATQAGIFTQHCISLNVTTADTVVDAGDVYQLRQFIEGLNVASFGFGQAGSRFVTLSFWVKGTKTGIHNVAFKNNTPDRTYIAEYTIVTTNTWEYKTITIPVDTIGTWLYDTGVGLRIDFTLACGTNRHTTANTWTAGNFNGSANQVNALDTIGNTFKIALVQLEAGSVATSFDVRSVGQELALCQRYYYASAPKLAGTASNSSTQVWRIGGNHPVIMRASPTATIGTIGLQCGVNSATITSIASNYSNATLFEIDGGTTVNAFTAGQGVVSYSSSVNNIFCSAEL